MQDYWYKQTKEKPLFPDLIWSKPENKLTAGKLLIIGGNAHGFTAPATAYAEAVNAGTGTVRVLLPDSLSKTVGRQFSAGEFATSTPSGSFSQQALAEFMDLSVWADGVLIAGDLGRNSETTVLLEKYVSKSKALLTLVNDAVDDFVTTTNGITERQDTLLVLSLNQLQKLYSTLKLPTAVTHSMDLLRLVEALHELTLKFPFFVITHHLGQIMVAIGGEVSTTPKDQPLTQIAAHASVWWLQNPSKPFEALTSSLVSP